MKFVAPARSQLDAETFEHPVFAGLCEFQALLRAPDWPSLEQLNARLQPVQHTGTGLSLRFAAQDTLLDEDNYERRILRHGVVATRSGNWHDLLNALVWKKYPRMKSALNALQVTDMDRVGPHERTRRQCALTQFDEAGAVLVLREPALLQLWDTHGWDALFRQNASAWSDGRIELAVFGHALFEHALNRQMLLVSKTLVIADPDARLAGNDIDGCIADAMLALQCLDDPQSLRPLPLAGIPGWHPAIQDANFYRDTPCFRPVRAGRRYPEPLRVNSG